MERLLRIEDVVAMTGYAKCKIYEEMKAGRFPQSIPLYDEKDRARAWVASEIADFISKKIQKARSACRQ